MNPDLHILIGWTGSGNEFFESIQQQFGSSLDSVEPEASIDNSGASADAGNNATSTATDHYTPTELWTYPVQSVESLIYIRKQWDKYICSRNIPGGQRIPNGFVVPPFPPKNSTWEAYIVQQTAPHSKPK